MLLDALCKRASPEQYDVPLGSDAIWDIMGGSGSSSSGVSVTRQTVLGYPACFRAVKLLSSDVAKLPMLVYRRILDGGKERDNTHPAYWLMHRKANQWMTAFVFRQTMMGHALLHGNGYAYVFRDESATPQDLMILDPETVTPIKEDGRLLYLVVNMRLADGQLGDRKLLPENVLHIRGLSHTGFVGYSIIDTLRESLGLGLVAQKYESIFFRNNARPSMVIEMPGMLKDEEAINRLRNSWGKIHEGIENSNRPALLEQGAKVNTLSVSNEDAQFLQLREFELRQIANIFGVPSHKLSDNTKSSYSSLEAENQSYLQDSLDPWLCNWERECEDKLFTESEKRTDSHVIEFQRDAIIRTDKKTETEALAVEVNNGLLSLDEARAIKNRPPVPNGLGAGYRKPMNIEILGAEPEASPIPDPPAGSAPGDEEDEEDDDRSQPPGRLVPEDRFQKILDSHRTWLARCMRRMVVRVGVGANKASVRPDKFHGWLLDHMIDKNRAAWIDQTRDSIEACALLTDSTSAINVEDSIDEMLGGLRDSLNELSGTVPAERLPLAIKEHMARFAVELPDQFADSIIRKVTHYRENNDAA